MPRDDVIIDFGGDIQNVRKSLGEIDSAIVGFRSNLAGLGPLFGLAGLAGAGTALTDFIDQMDELGATAQGLNTTTEALYQLQFAVGQTSKVTEQELNTVLQKLIKHIGKANTGSKESQAIFSELGLAWENLARLQSDQAFLLVVDAINALPDAYSKAALAQRLFEDPWRKLMPSLLAGGTALRDLMGEVEGPTAELVGEAAAFNGAVDRLNRQLDELIFAVGPGVLAVLNDLIAVFTAGAGKAQDLYAAFESFRAQVLDPESTLGPWVQMLNDLLNPMAQVERGLPALRQVLGIAEPSGAPTAPGVPAAPGEGVAPGLPSRASQERARTRTKAAKREAVSDTREQARQEGLIWQEYHAEINALQEGNTAAAQQAQEAQIRALESLVRAGASRAREEFYRALVAEDTTVPPAKMRVVLDEESLFALPDELEQALQSGQYDVTIRAAVVPTLLVSDEVGRAVDQTGGTP